MVIAGMPRLASGPCLMVTLPLDLSTFFTSPVLIGAVLSMDLAPLCCGVARSSAAVAPRGNARPRVTARRIEGVRVGGCDGREYGWWAFSGLDLDAAKWGSRCRAGRRPGPAGRP